MILDKLYVMLPGVACIIMMIGLWMALWKRDKRIPLFDVGIFCALATVVYTVYPLVNYWADGWQFGQFSDARLQAYEITHLELGLFHLRHVLYMFAFVSVYALCRGKSLMCTGNIMTPGPSFTKVVTCLVLLLTCYFYGLQMMTGVSFNASYEMISYYDNLAALLSLPLIVLQISIKLAGILFLFKIALLALVIGRCRKKQWLIVLLVWLAAEIVQAVLVKGGRTNLILFLLASPLFYHRMIRPISVRFLLAFGVTVLIGFIFLGYYRVYYDLAEMRLDLAQAKAGMFSGNNEFQVLLGTAYDVLHLKREGSYLPWYLYINDFIAILPPQQLLPFEKVPASEWYLRELGLSGSGLGLMWGVISQSIVGLDWLELAMRGALLGYILAIVHRWYQNWQSNFMATIFYVFLCLKVYYTFRDTTLSILVNLVWEWIPFCLILRIGLAIISRRMKPNLRIPLIHSNRGAIGCNPP